MFPSLRSEHVKLGVERFLAYLYSRHLEQEQEQEQEQEKNSGKTK